jgi:hypothetical protein
VSIAGNHTLHVLAGLVWNMKAERQVKQALAASNTIADDCVQITRGPGAAVSAVVLDEVTHMPKYTLQQPREKHACCTCPAATQGAACKHQLRVLCDLFPHPRTPGMCTLSSGSVAMCAMPILL